MEPPLREPAWEEMVAWPKFQVLPANGWLEQDSRAHLPVDAIGVSMRAGPVGRNRPRDIPGKGEFGPDLAVTPLRPCPSEREQQDTGTMANNSHCLSRGTQEDAG
jgi:hypothetical protein